MCAYYKNNSNPPVEPMWRTRRGKEYKISKMDINHLRNCIALLERQMRTNLQVYKHLTAELKKREEAKKAPMTRFDLMDLD